MRRRIETVDHETDGTLAWNDEGGFFVRLRGQATTLVATALLGGAPWWLPSDTKPWQIRPDVAISVGVIVFGIVLSWALFYLRQRTIRSLRVKRDLHLFAHFIRNEHIRIRTRDPKLDIVTLSNQLCDHIKEYFSVLTHRRSHLGVAIRVGVPGPHGIEYVTVGRSGLNQHRGPTSQSLHESKGVAKLLRTEKGSKGVLFYEDIDAAVSLKLYEQQPNDREYPDDIKTFAVAPINGWDGRDKAMLGLLFLTSPSKGVFKKKHTDSIGFLADSIATLYTELAISRTHNLEAKQDELF